MPFGIRRTTTTTVNHKAEQTLGSIITKINSGPCTIKVKTALEAVVLTKGLIYAALKPNELSLSTLLKHTSIQVARDKPKSIVELLNSPDLVDCKASIQEYLGAFITYAATKEAHAECEELLAISKRPGIPERMKALSDKLISHQYPKLQKAFTLGICDDLEQIPFATLQTLFPEAISEVLSTDPDLLSTRCELVTSLLDRFGDDLAAVAGIYREPGTVAAYPILEAALMGSSNYESLKSCLPKGFELDKMLAGYIKKELVAAKLFTDEIISDLLAGKIDDAISKTEAIPEPKQSLIQKVLIHFGKILEESSTMGTKSYNRNPQALATAVFAIVNSPRKESTVTPPNTTPMDAVQFATKFATHTNTFLATLIDSRAVTSAVEVVEEDDAHATCASGGIAGGGSALVSQLRAEWAKRGLVHPAHGVEVSSATQTSTRMPASARAISFGGGHAGSGLRKELEARREERRETTPTGLNKSRPNTADSSASNSSGASKESVDSGIVLENWTEITPDEGAPYYKDTNYKNSDWVRIKQVEGEDTEPYYWNIKSGDVMAEDPRQATSTDA